MGIFKKSLAVVLAALMLVSVFSVVAFAADGDTNYIVAGVGELCGNAWAPADTANQMEDAGNGTFVKVYKDVPAMQNYQFKVTDGTWDNAWGANGDNFVFHVTDTCDVTITFDSAEKTVTVTGDNVVIPEGFKVDKVIAVGDNKADAAFLNGISWQENNDDNAMSTEDGKVYTITYKGVAAGDDYAFKFAVNGTWASNFGALKENPDGSSLQWDGDNIKFDVEFAKADVTLTLDLTNFDYDNGKTGATYSVNVVEASEEETTAPAEETTAPAEETTAPAEETTAPAEETTAPVEETTAPVEPTEAPKPDTPDTPDTPATPDTPDTPDTTPTTPAKPIVPGFYVVGSEEVCGAEWGWDKPWEYNEPMALSADGETYYQVFDNIKASAGNVTDEGNDIYVFKVVYVNENGAITWHPGGMGNNTCVTVAEDGSTVFFQFKLLASKPTKEGTDPEAVIATVYGPNDEKPEDFSKVPYPETPEETTVEPTTQAPTQVEPTTVAPTQPATEKATTAKKATNKAKVTVSKKAAKASAKTLKKKGIKVSKLIKITKAKGAKITYKILKKGTSKKIYKKIYVKGTKIKIKKKASVKKGTYKIKLQIKISATKKVKGKTIKKTVKLKVK